FAGRRASFGRLRRLLADRNRDAPRIDEAMREALERAAAQRRAYHAAVEAGLHTVTDTLSADALAKRFTDVIHAIGRRRRESELWRLFTLMGNELKQLAELRFQKEVDAHMRRHDEQRPASDPMTPDSLRPDSLAPGSAARGPRR
ncbi:type VI secretion system-associated FHA domain protein, partial [Acidisphaera rubrifaciens]|uniref:type VI secretion system-associated FHA domain protein n=1 Tax=Acidisphaera rubrifaciens TaxID=50715 RepID=UPI000662B865